MASPAALVDSAEAGELRSPAEHPATAAPATLILLIVLSAFGAIIGTQLILQLGVTPNTSIIGALVAMLLARVPLAFSAATVRSTSRTWRRARSRRQPLARLTVSCCRSASRSCWAGPI
jgi:hypothetical protein